MSSEPIPYIVAPTNDFDGDDGSWSTFAVEVGTPPQSFRVLPATFGQEALLPVPDGCAQFTFKGCGDMRGANAVDGGPSSGFQMNESSTWVYAPRDPYVLSDATNLFGTKNTGMYGSDTIALANKATGTSGDPIKSQTIAGILTSDFWLGTIGLGNVEIQYGDGSAGQSMLASMKNQSLVPSLSYGYTAGQSYCECLLLRTFAHRR
jgi:hypothetical protein